MEKERRWEFDEQETEPDNYLHVNEIQQEYARIDRDWLGLHVRVSGGLVVFAFLVECVMGVMIVNSDILTTTISRYLWKFLFVPTGFNLLISLAEVAMMRSKRLSQDQKIYMASMCFTAICFVLFTVHNVFPATYYLFTVATMLTVVYASYRVTSITAVAGVVSMTLSEIFIQWDIDKESIFHSAMRMSNFMVSLFISTGFALICMVIIRYERKKNEASIQMELERHRLQRSLQVDELTGISNRKALRSALKAMEVDLSGDRYVLAVTDIDYFKSINDTWGHHAGDCCLIAFAELLRGYTPQFVAYRYGGDEFCLLFRRSTLQEAADVCEQLRKQISELRLKEQPALRFTASFGLAALEEHIDAGLLFIHADHALYEAKSRRNAVRIFHKKAQVTKQEPAMPEFSAQFE